MYLQSVNVHNIDDSHVLDKARKVYGNKNQILVSIEELNELACVLAKFPRYDNEKEAIKDLHEKAVDELADVYIVLEHIKEILEISNFEISSRAEVKLARLERWLNHSQSMQETIDDRDVKPVTECGNCSNTSLCNSCICNEAVEGVKPYFKPTLHKRGR